MFVLISIIALTILLSPELSSQEFDATRRWTDSTGKFGVDAGLSSFNEISITLRKSDGEEVTLPRARLSDVDKEFLLAVTSLQQTEKQNELLSPHLSQIASKSLGVLEIVDALGKEYPYAIGSNFYGGMLHAATGNDRSSLSQSERRLTEVIEILHAIEKHFPGRHKTTLASALNNRAVLSLRQTNVLGAANYLAQAAEVSGEIIPYAVYHNASLLLSSSIDLGANRAKLVRVLARARPEGEGNVAKRLMYTFAHDSFSTPHDVGAKDGSAVSESIDASVTPPPGKFLSAYGSGFLIASQYLLTNRHVAETYDSFRVKNDSGETRIATVDLISNIPNVDLAVLKLSQPASALPIPIRNDQPRIGESFVVLGYPIPDVFEASITASRGIVSKLVENELQILHDASTDPGNSGGPCIDSKGNVIGVHFAGSNIAKNNRNYAVAPTAITPFVAKIAAYQPLPQSSSELDFSQIIDKWTNSVFMVECYSDKMTSVAASNASEKQDLMVQFSLLPDMCCLMCMGKGHVDCPSCVNGFNSVTKTVRVGINTLTGAPILGPKAFKVKCSKCGRAGHVRCPTCRGAGWAQ